MNYDIFISYRRANISYARNIYYALKDKGYTSIFFDMDSVREGLFPDQIREAVKGCTNFILVLSPGSMDRCSNPGDWVAEEISLAIEHNKNILPVVIGASFTWPASVPNRIKK
ncbi:MAG: toll/interleukin-1 receptor domain-containing protein [Paludibacteraceae bacterium]|nr:toll/interleukin-1 receptor domain-containing protein [Paludibacteraceae bacterium]